MEVLAKFINSQMIAKHCPDYSFDKKSTIVAVSGSGNVAQVSLAYL